MKILLNCEISLSKKLRKILGTSGSVTLIAENLSDGKGYGNLVLQSDRNVDMSGELPEELKGETSIQFTPIEITQQKPPTLESKPIASVFATSETPNKGERTVVDRMAAVEVPENDEQVPHAIVQKEEIPTPNAFNELNNPKCSGFVMSLEELLGEIEVSKEKESNIQIDNISDPFKRAVAMEKKEKLESINRSAYVVQEEAAVLTVNDLGITLSLNAPYDLSNISAKRLAESSELKGLIKSGLVKFVAPDEIDSYVKKAEASHRTYGLDVFDDHEQAEANMASDGSSSYKETQIIDSSKEMGEKELMEATEEESMMMDLTNLMSTPMPEGDGSDVVRTTSGVRSSRHSA
jgi:hypothetical protein